MFVEMLSIIWPIQHLAHFNSECIFLSQIQKQIPKSFQFFLRPFAFFYSKVLLSILAALLLSDKSMTCIFFFPELFSIIKLPENEDKLGRRSFFSGTKFYSLIEVSLLFFTSILTPFRA